MGVTGVGSSRLSTDKRVNEPVNNKDRVTSREGFLSTRSATSRYKRDLYSPSLLFH